MKNVKTFQKETADYLNLADLVLEPQDVREFEAGTRFWQVKVFNGDSGNCVSIEYVLRDIDNSDEVLGDMQAVGAGYFSETSGVIRK